MSIKLIIYLVERDGFVTKGLTKYIYIYIFQKLSSNGI